eukprot:33695-Chlamydomonas_euryale.AAC.1
MALAVAAGATGAGAAAAIGGSALAGSAGSASLGMVSAVQRFALTANVAANFSDAYRGAACGLQWANFQARQGRVQLLGQTGRRRVQLLGQTGRRRVQLLGQAGGEA